MRRRFGLSLLVFCVGFAGLVTVSSPAGGVAGFGDVGESAFYTRAVQWMVDNAITTGTSATCFSPDDPVTRGQAAAFMWRMEGSPPTAPHPFTDVTAGYQQGPVSWMAVNKITTGTTPTTYSPDDQLARGQLAALLHRLAGSPAAVGHPFVDIVHVWQQVPVAWMVANNITTGTSPTMFSPDDTVTRGQLAAFFYRYKGLPPVAIDPESPTCSGEPPPTTTTTTSVPPANVAVTIIDFAFTPADRTVLVGNSVTWTWTGSASHSTTSTGNWDSGIRQLGSFTRQFDTRGTFSYFCQVHASMTGTITVN